MAVVLTCYYRPKPGGLCVRLVRAMRALLDQGHHLHYLAVSPFPVEHENCRFHRFPWPEKLADTWLFWGVFHLMAPLMLFWLALRFKVTHAFGFTATYACFLQPLRIVQRIDVTCFLRGDALFAHGLKKRPGWIIRIDKTIEGLGVHGTRLACAQNPLLESVLRRHPKARPAMTTILPNDLQPVASAPRKARLPLRLGMAGILEPVKNQAWGIDLMTSFSKTDVHLHLFGDGPDLEWLQSLVKNKDLSDRVTFQGWVAPHRLWPRLDVLLMPSLREGMPNAVLEAIGRRIPVLASDIAAHREILPAAHCLPLDKPGLWRTALAKMVKDPRAELGAMATVQLEQAQGLVFDWEARVADFIIRR